MGDIGQSNIEPGYLRISTASKSNRGSRVSGFSNGDRTSDAFRRRARPDDSYYTLVGVAMSSRLLTHGILRILGWKYTLLHDDSSCKEVGLWSVHVSLTSEAPSPDSLWTSWYLHCWERQWYLVSGRSFWELTKGIVESEQLRLHTLFGSNLYGLCTNIAAWPKDKSGIGGSGLVRYERFDSALCQGIVVGRISRRQGGKSPRAGIHHVSGC
jgi:hypothetical protein